VSIFKEYANYYDILYKDKNYQEEAGYVNDLIKRFHKKANSLLELGCGTGKLALHLGNTGSSVVGVDISQEMLAQANINRSMDSGVHDVEFLHGDLRTVRLSRKFDIILSLFHAFSYQTTNDDFAAALTTVINHLNPDGILIFDCWYGPAVLSNKPAIRVKTLEDNTQKIIRIAEPALRTSTNTVDVNYTILIKDIESNLVNEVNEIHSMRYFFLPEILFFLQSTGLSMLHSEEFLTGKKLDCESWNAVIVASKCLGKALPG
jgi:SAM-dependent methyltransferase